MLYVIYRGNADLEYKRGQEEIVHIEADLKTTVDWAIANSQRWAFTLSNASAYYFETRISLEALSDLNWDAINSIDWRDPKIKEGKQAEFLLESAFPVSLIARIGVFENRISDAVQSACADYSVSTPVEVKPDWYYR